MRMPRVRCSLPRLGPIRQLVERLDGQSLFGRPLEALDESTFNTYTQRLGVSAVVALEDDLSRLPALADNPRFPRRTSEPPFVIWLGTPAALPPPLEPGPWRVTLEAPPGGWASAHVAYYPLWSAHGAGAALDTRRGQLGDLEVRLPAGRTTLELSYEPGPVEWAGVGLTALGLLAWLAAAWRLTRRR